MGRVDAWDVYAYIAFVRLEWAIQREVRNLEVKISMNFDKEFISDIFTVYLRSYIHLIARVTKIYLATYSKSRSRGITNMRLEDIIEYFKNGFASGKRKPYKDNLE